MPTNNALTRRPILCALMAAAFAFGLMLVAARYESVSTISAPAIPAGCV